MAWRGAGPYVCRAFALVAAMVLAAVLPASAFAKDPPSYLSSFGSYGGEAGSFDHPADVAVDSEGNLWVVDQYNNRVQKFDEGGEYLSQFGSSGSEGGQFHRPTSIAIDPEGNLWITDAENNRIEQFDDEGEFIKSIGSSGSGNGQFSEPEGIAVDVEGNIWVADTYNGRVQEFNDAGEFVRVVGSSGSEEGELAAPKAIDVGPGGDVWIADWENNRISVFGSAGQLVREFGSEGGGEGEFLHPDAIDVDAAGSVWVGDENGRIQQFDEEGEYVTQFGVWGSGERQFWLEYPFGITTAAGEQLWIADSGNHRIQVWDKRPIASCWDGGASTHIDQPFVLKAGALECEGEAPLSYEIVVGPEHGKISGFNAETGALTYTPDSEYVGPDSFTFQASNVYGSSAVTTFHVDVGGGLIADCHDLGATIEVEQFLFLEAGELECKGEEPLSYELVDSPKHGEILEFSSATGAVIYWPDSEYSGLDSLTFRARNIYGASAVATLHIAVGESPATECNEGDASTKVDQPLALKAGALDCEGEPPLSYEIVGGPEHGEISGFNAKTGALTYTPDSEYSGPDAFTFRATSVFGSSSVTSFEVEVAEAPDCKDIAISTKPNEALPLSLNCSGHFLESGYEIVAEPTHGAISKFDPELGTLTYTPETGFRGLDEITYRRSSWIHNSKATVSIGVCNPPTLGVGGEVKDPETPGVDLELSAEVGKPTCDVSRIAAFRVYIDEELAYSEQRSCPLEPEDPCWPGQWLRSLQLPYEKVVGSHDYLVEAEDQFGAQAKPQEWTEETPEEGTILDLEAEVSEEGKCRAPRKIQHVLVGTKCADVLTPRSGVRVYRGLGGDDLIYGGGRTETIQGGGGNDTIFAGRGSDEIRGGDGGDHLFAGSGDDEVDGNEGGDILVGGPGRDKILGRGGDDLVRGGTTIDILDGGGGVNTLSFADGVTPGFYLFPGSGSQVDLPSGFPKKHGQRGVYVNLGAGKPIADNGEVARFGGGEDEIKGNGFQNVIGTAFADLIVGSGDPNEIDAGPGTDVVRGGGDDDTIYGGSDQDHLDGESGEDELDGGTGSEDTCLSASKSSNCDNSNPETTLVQPNAETIAVGLLASGSALGQQDLYLRGTDGKDQVTATWDSGTIELKITGGASVFGSAEGGSGCIITGGEVEVEGPEASCVVPGTDSILMFGDAGEDRLQVQGFPKEVSVTLLGGEGDDALIGGAETEDVLVDGPDAGEDHLVGNSGDDTLFANEGKDTLLGSSGEDLFVSAEVCDGDVIRGGDGSDNANWAQFVGAEVKSGDDEYPSDIEDLVFETPVNHGARVRLAGGSISRQSTGCNGYGGEDVGSIGGVENVEGSHGPDVLVGDGGRNVLLGRGGADVLRSRAGNDTILANNRDPKGKTLAEKRDLDLRLECSFGKDTIKLDPADRKHFSAAGLKGCETPPDQQVKPASNSRVLERALKVSYEGSGDALDEAEIGAAGDPDAAGPVAFYRFDETEGTEARDWVDPEDVEGEEEGEGVEESEEEAEELAEEEGEEEEPESESEEGEEAPHPGTYENGVGLAETGAMEESLAAHLDGVNDYIDLTASWDPQEFVVHDCGESVSGYSVEMWVKFDAEAAGREELFSRSQGEGGISLYRSGDGRLNLSVVDASESPTVSTDRAVDSGEWHHVVATMAEREESCPTIAPLSLSPEEDLESLEDPRLTLYVDGFSYALGLDGYNLIPSFLSSVHNIVGARDGEGGFSNWLDATVDDVAIYGEALSSEEVASHLALSDAPEPSLYLEPPADTGDADEDGVADEIDNCAEVANPEQEDSDFNGVGDACEPEPDSDEDGVADEYDNCPFDQNPLQEDEDEDEVGDVCEVVE